MSTHDETARAVRARRRETSRPGGPQVRPLRLTVVASIAALGGLLFGYDLKIAHRPQGRKEGDQEHHCSGRAVHMLGRGGTSVPWGTGGARRDRQRRQRS